MNMNNISNFKYIAIFTILVYSVFAYLILSETIIEYNTHLLIISGINIIIVLSLNLITGFCGQLALGHAGFMAVGAYVAAISTVKFEIPIIVSVLLAGFVASIFGIFIGLPTLKLRGDYFAIATLGFGIVIKVLIEYFENLTGGASGFKSIPHMVEGDDYILNSFYNFTIVFFVCVIFIIVIKNLLKSSHGRVILSIREDEVAANSMGINIYKYKMFVFVLSAFIAGVGGSLFAFYQGYIDPKMSDFMRSVDFVVMLVFGGLGNVTGTVFSATLLTFLPEKLRFLQDFRLVMYGFLLIIIMIYRRQGVLGNLELSISGIVNKLLPLKKNQGVD